MGLACLQLSIFENESCNLINGENDAIATELRFLRIYVYQKRSWRIRRLTKYCGLVKEIV